MMIFRKKPNEVYAEQWTGPQMPEGICAACSAFQTGPHIHTDHGQMEIKPGEWVITAADGRRWANDPEYFEANYEPVEVAPADQPEEETSMAKRKMPKGKKGGKC